MEQIPTDVMEKAVNIVGDPNLTDKEIEKQVRMLVTNDISARRLIDFIPEAFGYVFVSHLAKVKLPQQFGARNSKGAVVMLEMELEPIIKESVVIATKLFHNGPKVIFQTVVSKSSLFDIVNDALNEGKDLSGGEFSGPIMPGIPAEIYGYELPPQNMDKVLSHRSKPWWRIW